MCTSDPIFYKSLVDEFGEDIVQRFLHSRYIDVRVSGMEDRETLAHSMIDLLYRSFLQAFGRSDEAMGLWENSQGFTTMGEVVNYFMKEEDAFREAEAVQTGKQSVPSAFFIHWYRVSYQNVLYYGYLQHSFYIGGLYRLHKAHLPKLAVPRFLRSQ